MRKLLPIVVAILVGACPTAAAGESRETFGVVFEVVLAEGGEIRTLKVEHVTDGTGRRRNVKVPKAYVAAARGMLQPRYRGKPAGRFFTFTLYDPGRPSDASFGAGDRPPADPRRTVELRPGQSAILRVRPDGTLDLAERSEVPQTPASQMEDVIVRGMASGEIGRSQEGTLPASPLKHLPAAPAISDGAVRLTLKQAAGGNTALVVENGYDQILYYRAWMRTDGRNSATSVCEVAPKIPSYEHWPHPIERLDLAGFGLRRPAAGREIECQ